LKCCKIFGKGADDAPQHSFVGGERKGEGREGDRMSRREGLPIWLTVSFWAHRITHRIVWRRMLFRSLLCTHQGCGDKPSAACAGRDPDISTRHISSSDISPPDIPPPGQFPLPFYMVYDISPYRRHHAPM